MAVKAPSHPGSEPLGYLWFLLLPHPDILSRKSCYFSSSVPLFLGFLSFWMPPPHAGSNVSCLDCYDSPLTSLPGQAPAVPVGCISNCQWVTQRPAVIMSPPCSKASSGMKAQLCSCYCFPWSKPNLYLPAVACYNPWSNWIKLPKHTSDLCLCIFHWLCLNILSPNSAVQNPGHSARTVAVVVPRLGVQALEYNEPDQLTEIWAWQVIKLPCVSVSTNARWEYIIPHWARGRIKQVNA